MCVPIKTDGLGQNFDRSQWSNRIWVHINFPRVIFILLCEGSKSFKSPKILETRSFTSVCGLFKIYGLYDIHVKDNGHWFPRDLPSPWLPRSYFWVLLVEDYPEYKTLDESKVYVVSVVITSVQTNKTPENVWYLHRNVRTQTSFTPR